MTYYLSLGANLGEREQSIQRALKMIEEKIGTVTHCSSFFYSEPWGFESPNGFCNLCCALTTKMQPLEVLATTQTIERLLGRTRKRNFTKEGESVQYTDRCIDIDLIQAFDEEGNEIHMRYMPSSKGKAGERLWLELPHPLWQKRDFVLIPMKELTSVKG